MVSNRSSMWPSTFGQPALLPQIKGNNKEQKRSANMQNRVCIATSCMGCLEDNAIYSIVPRKNRI
jgi:hypothetical protein